MRPHVFSTLVLLLSLAMAGTVGCEEPKGASVARPPQPVAARAATSGLPVRAVSLFSSGVGYFQHAGNVAGGAEVQLHFKAEQINDLLKSLVLEDLDGGKPGFVVYPSRDPLERILGGFAVDLTERPTLSNLLQQLAGAEVAAQYQGEVIVGKLLGVETRPVGVDAKGESMADWVVNLYADGAMRALPLREVTRLELRDAKLRSELEGALSALDQGRGRDKKPVTLRFPGEGMHRVRVGYVVESPVWKSSYRVLLGDGGKKEAHLQGWAIVENQTDHDWENVRLSLVSGRPISFVQDLYEPLYAQRPRVEPPRPAGVAPRLHEGEAPKPVGMPGAYPPPSPAPMMKMMEVPEEAMASAAAGSGGGGGWEARSVQAQRIEAQALAQEVGELFQYTVEGVTLPRQRSAMIPIVSEAIGVEKVSIYNQDDLAEHPLNGLVLVNGTGKLLPAGPMALFDGGSFAGDARLPDLPAGQKRLVSYAVDLDVRAAVPEGGEEEEILAGKVVKGVLELTRKLRREKRYALENRADKEKIVLVEHPYESGWELKETAGAEETTASHRRFRVVLPGHGGQNLVVREERVLSEEVALLPESVDDLLVYAQEGKLSGGTREALEEVVRRKRSVEASEREITSGEERLGKLTEEQGRIHVNLKTVQAGSPFHSRMMTRLDQVETLIENLQSGMEGLRGKVEKEQKELEGYLEGLSVE